MQTNAEAESIYREVQHFRQVWLWILVALTTGSIWYTAIGQLFLDRPVGPNPMSDTMAIVFWIIFGLGLPVFFLTSRLITEVRRDGIYVRFVPLHRTFHRIAFADLQDYEARTYRPVLEYGGWGIRFGRQGKAYTVGGNRGMQLTLREGRRLLIGSQQPEQFRQAIESQMRYHEGLYTNEDKNLSAD